MSDTDTDGCSIFNFGVKIAPDFFILFFLVY